MSGLYRVVVGRIDEVIGETRFAISRATPEPPFVKRVPIEGVKIEDPLPALLTGFRRETLETPCLAGFFGARPTQAHLRYVEEGELRKTRQGMVYRSS